MYRLEPTRSTCNPNRYSILPEYPWRSFRYILLVSVETHKLRQMRYRKGYQLIVWSSYGYIALDYGCWKSILCAKYRPKLQARAAEKFICSKLLLFRVNIRRKCRLQVFVKNTVSSSNGLSKSYIPTMPSYKEPISWLGFCFHDQDKAICVAVNAKFSILAVGTQR